MTRNDDEGRGLARDEDRRGPARRTAVAAAWSVPVIAAALTAPAAAASAPGVPFSRGTPLHLDDGPFVGFVLRADPAAAGRFGLELRVSASVELGAPVVLAAEARVDLTTDHDVSAWADGIVADSPRTAHVLLPAGAYPTDGRISVDGKGQEYLSVVITGKRLVSQLSALPRGRATVTASVTSGPVYTGTNSLVKIATGSISTTIVLEL
ncbi:hypothetical protein [Rathayibacter sp. VKM Ac-2760]|uniref:hypothetical protein n=1 Tax=Rathayibacter sp. VKM Ac-2760 TaxID=2609253 RepID=UPI001317C900|nr:hypothetical protein [Rathayibacter sp. VKM Ac-2760]QHC58468.1 hypothetical protein GSU72_07865 [Rathayibacter sp. VKM Ac-2760]